MSSLLGGSCQRSSRFTIPLPFALPLAFLSPCFSPDIQFFPKAYPQNTNLTMDPDETASDLSADEVEVPQSKTTDKHRTRNAMFSAL